MIRSGRSGTPLTPRLGRRGLLKTGALCAMPLLLGGCAIRLPRTARAQPDVGVVGMPAHAGHETPAAAPSGAAGTFVQGLPPDAPPPAWEARNPAEILTAVDVGRTSQLANGQTLREYTLIAREADVEVAPGPRLAPGGSATIGLAYPWLPGERLEVKLVTSRGQMVARSAAANETAGVAESPARWPAFPWEVVAGGIAVLAATASVAWAPRLGDPRPGTGAGAQTAGVARLRGSPVAVGMPRPVPGVGPGRCAWMPGASQPTSSAHGRPGVRSPPTAATATKPKV